MAALLKQMVMPFLPAVSYQADDFVRGSANEAALSLVERWPDWPYSLVVVHGPAGSGKTHLAHVFAARTQASFIPVERIGTVPAEMLLTGRHCWVIDGLEAIAHEAAFAQLINHARARGDYVLMTSRVAPSQLPFTLNDLRSRVTALSEVALGLPDEMLLKAVLIKEFADRQLRVTPEVMEYATTRIERSLDAVQRLAATLDEVSLASGRRVNLALVRQVLNA